MVEDLWFGMYKNPDNFISIPPYEALYEDSELKNYLMDLLDILKDTPDVRPYLRCKFGHLYNWANDDVFYDLTP
eukprot:CAMPEP_0168316140 /NCGR_PEP_ID=MMETSP0210-20121227/14585_1 /TAXON_ID=40633 /ORGANISM="Condylostoma magnum, Strain COL2" /LENGTH=73 /DNA_ID=CAMNT_0008295283 /DNA_START=455 /DNA_END=676 /DNA_ORIENTATION=+